MSAKGPGLSLHDAERMKLVIRVTCNYCRDTRYYVPGDLRHLLGNREIDSLYQRVRCEQCGKKDYMAVEGKSLYPQERFGLTLRRLKEVRIVRRPVWEDEPM